MPSDNVLRGDGFGETPVPSAMSGASSRVMTSRSLYRGGNLLAVKKIARGREPDSRLVSQFTSIVARLLVDERYARAVAASPATMLRGSGLTAGQAAAVA